MFSLATTAALGFAAFATAQTGYGDSSPPSKCTTTLTATSVSCCGTIAGQTATSYINCGGCAPEYFPIPLCRCIAPPVTDYKLTTTETSCYASATPYMEVRVKRNDEPVAGIPEWCKVAMFPAIYPPTQAQRCCEGDLRLCDGLPDPTQTNEKRDEEPPTVPEWCAYTSFTLEYPPSQHAQCCGGDLKACEGLSPPIWNPEDGETEDQELSAVPTWCANIKFTMEYPPNQYARCCLYNDLRACDGLTAPGDKKRNPTPGVPAWCKDASFPIIYPPTPAQRCCEGDLRACDGVSPPSESESKRQVGRPIPVPEWCETVNYMKDFPKAQRNQAKRCCNGDLRLCDGLTPPSTLPPGVPAWCEGAAFIAIFPPTQAQQCCEGNLKLCDGPTDPNVTEPAPSPCTTTATYFKNPCGD